MLGGRAAVISHAIKKKKNKENRYEKEIEIKNEAKMMRKYGLEEMPKKKPDLEAFNEIRMNHLRNYQSQLDQQTGDSYPKSAQMGILPPSRADQDGFYSHHAEVMAAKLEMENQERIKELTEAEQEKLRKETLGKWEKEFDDLSKDLKNNNPRAGELRVKKRQYLMPDDEAVDLGQINIREATEDRLIFRRMPILIWFSGMVIILLAVYLIYHLALGQFGVLFDGYREGHWWQYLISLGILILGFSFMYAGKIDSLILDKTMGVMTLEKTTIFCKN